jgi:hypothetical protein
MQSTGGFTAEIEYNGESFEYTYSKTLKGQENISVAEIAINNGVMTFISSLPNTSTISSKDIWSIGTQKFHKVSMILNSPNYWNTKVGNKHTFFILDGAVNPEKPRGLFNEYLSNKYVEYRKVFDLLGDKTRLADSSEQLSGVGFSETQRNEVFLKVSGDYTRVIKVRF